METKVKKLLRRITKAKEIKLRRESELMEAYMYMLPTRDTLSNKSSTSNNQEAYNSTAEEALEKFATKLQNLLTPAWEEWLKLQPGTDIPEEKHGQVQEQLDKVSKVVFAHIHHSNFYTAEHEAFLDLGITTGAIIVEPNRRDNEPSALNHRSIPISELIPETSSRGTIDTVWREFKPKVRDIEYIWSNAKVPQELLDKVEGNEDYETTVYEGVVFNEETSKYDFYVIEKSLSKIMLEEEMNTSPFIVFRETVRPGEVLGNGRGLRILKTVKVLNKYEENALRGDGFNALPMFTVIDDGVINPYNNPLQPGGMFVVGSNENSNPSIKPLISGYNPQFTEAKIQKYEAQINEIFLANPYGSIEQTPVRSATEIAAREADLFQTTASAFGRLQTEFLEKYMRRVIDVLNQEGKLPPFKLDGREVSIKFTSPFSKMQGSENVKNTLNWMSYVAPLGPEVMAMAVNMDKIPSNLAKNMGIDKELYKDSEEMDMNKQQMAQAAMAYTQQGGQLPEMQGMQQPQQMPLV